MIGRTSKEKQPKGCFFGAIFFSHYRLLYIYPTIVIAIQYTTQSTTQHHANTPLNHTDQSTR